MLLNIHWIYHKHSNDITPTWWTQHKQHQIKSDLNMNSPVDYNRKYDFGNGFLWQKMLCIITLFVIYWPLYASWERCMLLPIFICILYIHIISFNSVTFLPIIEYITYPFYIMTGRINDNKCAWTIILNKIIIMYCAKPYKNHSLIK